MLPERRNGIPNGNVRPDGGGARRGELRIGPFITFRRLRIRNACYQKDAEKETDLPSFPSFFCLGGGVFTKKKPTVKFACSIKAELSLTL